MKTSTLVLLLVLSLATTARTADDLTAVLQQALFSEEADHDLAAAIKAYQSVVAGADAQRKLAATAVFRLGECYRKLGQTNEAIAQYQRILSDFTDQTNLVTLSRQNLTGLGANTERPRGKGMMGLTLDELLKLQAAQNPAGGRAEPTPAQAEAHRLLIQRLQLEIKGVETIQARQKESTRVPQSSRQEIEVRLLDLRRQLILAQDAGPAGPMDNAEATRAEALLKQLQALSRDELRRALPTVAPDPLLNSLLEQLAEAERRLASQRTSLADDHPTVKETREVLKAIQLQVDERIDGIMKGLSIKAAALKQQSGEFVGGRERTDAPAATDEEDKEVRRIQALIKDSPDLVNAKNVQVGMTGDRTRSGTPLHKAAQQGQLVVARFLIDNKADLDSRDDFGRTPLHWAAMNGHKSMAELLLSKGADPNASINPSARAGSAGQTPLHLAAQNGYRNVCEALLAGKADLNAKDTYGQTPLHLAADRGFSSVAELLLTRGANANAMTSGGTTPLHNAAGSGSKRLVELLLAHKADINAQNAQGGTPLYSAVAGKHTEVVRLLLANKGNPNLALNEKTQNPGWTPLVAAISQEDVPMARLLLENGADPNVLWYSNGYTVLMQAAQKGALELAEALIAAGADVNARYTGDARGTALLVVTSNNPTNAAAIVELLLKNKAEVNVADANGYTPLIQAVVKRNLDVVKLLVEHGADVNAMTRQGESPLSLIKPQHQQGLGGLPFRAQQPTVYNVMVAGAPGQPAQPPPDPTSEIIALLTQRGARDDLQRFSAISTTRNQENRIVRFSKGTNDWNRYTLLDLIATVYQGETSYRFPDFSKIAISRIDANTSRTVDIRIDLETAFRNKDCAQERPLEWGDIVEIPEQDHLISDSWGGLSRTAYLALQICLERNIRVVVKGQATNVVLTPFRDKKTPVSDEKNTWEARMDRFRLTRFLRNSGLLLASSDVTRVKVKRTDPATRQVRERVFDLDQIQSQIQRGEDSNDLWLRDGDVIEVPEKDASRAAASPRADASDETFSVQLNFEPIDANVTIQAEPITFQFTPLPSKE